MTTQLFNVTPDILRIQTIVNYLRQYPTQQQQRVIDEQLMLAPTAYANGKKILEPLEEATICESHNSIILYTTNNDKVKLTIDDTTELDETSLFCYVGEPIKVEATNISTTDSVEVRFVIAKNDLAASS